MYFLARRTTGPQSLRLVAADVGRYEHCIGVSHLAGRVMERFVVTQPELHITPREVRVFVDSIRGSSSQIELVKMAGLCHDLGHGPFSHAFESWMHKKTCVAHRSERISEVLSCSSAEWHHETMSVRMLEKMVEENNLNYGKEDVNFISELIIGKRVRDPSRGFLHEIVANYRCVCTPWLCIVRRSERVQRPAEFNACSGTALTWTSSITSRGTASISA